MNLIQPMKALAAVCAAVFIFTSCQKEANLDSGEMETNAARNSGLIPDDPELVRRVPVLMSAEFAGLSIAGRGKDTDKDGIPDAMDQCKTSKETYNGYQDTDGCPDTVPSNTDTDSDGFPDQQDACPTSAETYNGYQDTDGCPDTPPSDTIIVTPTPSPIPSSYQLNMPPVGQQGGEFSCVAWAVTYARSAEQYYKNGATSYSESSNILSPEYLYNQVKFSEHCSSGTGLYTALNFVKNNGICTWTGMPYSNTNGCSLLPNSTQQAEAANYRISTFSQILVADQIAIKTLLSQNHPLMAGTSIDGNFTNATAGYIWNAFSGSFGTNHGYTLCGYDDAKHAYRAINSWGTGWADAGYIWIDYDFFGTLPGSLYVISGL